MSSINDVGQFTTDIFEFVILKFKRFQTLDLEYAGISIPPSWSSLLSSSNPPPRSSSKITRTASG